MFPGCPKQGQALRLPERTPSFLQGGHIVRKVQMVTDRELEILKILWSRGQASVREVQEDLIKLTGPVAYSTVQTLLNIMEEKKGLVRHTVEGRTFIFSPKKPAERTIRELTRRFVDRVFDGALDRVLVALLDAQSPNASELEKLRVMIDQARRAADSPRTAASEDA
jgi:BlaI family transcriptional regulator, penicillinase repressor